MSAWMHERACLRRRRMRGLWVLIALAVTATAAPVRAAEPASTGAEGEITRIMGAKDAAVEQADKQYIERIDSADKQYTQTLAQAQAQRAKTIASARLSAAGQLKSVGKRMAQAGEVSGAIKLFKAVHRLRPQDAEAVAALAAAGVDVKAIRLEPDYEARRLDSRGHRIVLWNTHNSRYNTSGALECSVVLLKGTAVVWRSDPVAVPWKRNADTSATVLAPPRRFDTIRVEVNRWRGYSGGLAEIEVWRGEENIARGMPARASAAADSRTRAAAVTDGVTTSSTYKSGYWLLPDNQAGWVEVSLARPEYRALYRKKISARTPWQKVLKVTKGDVIDVTASGTWHASPDLVADADGGMVAGGNEGGKYSERFYLQGRLGKKVFKVGSSFTLRAEDDGELELGMNEAKAEWHVNNAGFLDVTLTIRKKPAPAPASRPEGKTTHTASAAPVVAGAP